MAKRRRRTLEERLAAAEEQLAALRTKRLTYTERRAAQNLPDVERILRRVRRYEARSDKREAAWERLSVPNQLKHKRRELTKLNARWETRDEELKQYAGQRLPYSVRIHLDERHYLHSRHSLEADILELEGEPPERITKLRWAADETLRQGRPVSPDEYEKAHAPPPVPAAASVKALHDHEPREWRPKPKERDVLAEYRDQRLNWPDGPRSYEPEYT